MRALRAGSLIAVAASAGFAAATPAAAEIPKSRAVLSADPSAVQVDALDGVAAWAANERIYVRRGGVTRRTTRVLRWKAAERYVGVRDGHLDLGRDSRDRLVAVFNACADGCPPQVLDTATMRIRSLRLPVPRGCRVGPAALWRSRALYAVRCSGSAERVEVRERGRSRRIGPVGWPHDRWSWPTIMRLDLRGRIALAFVYAGDVTLLDTQSRCRRFVDGHYNDGQVPAYLRALSPHLSGTMITWARNAFADMEQPGDFRLTGSSMGTVATATGCRLRRSPWAPDIPGAGPKDYRVPAAVSEMDAEITSVALDGNRVYVTIKGVGLVAGPME